MYGLSTYTFVITTHLTATLTHLGIVHPLVEGECEAWVSRDVLVVERHIQTIVEVPVKMCGEGRGECDIRIIHWLHAEVTAGSTFPENCTLNLEKYPVHGSVASGPQHLR